MAHQQLELLLVVVITHVLLQAAEAVAVLMLAQHKMEPLGVLMLQLAETSLLLVALPPEETVKYLQLLVQQVQFFQLQAKVFLEMAEAVALLA